MGAYFAFEQEDVQPDIVTIGKGLGGGYAPIAGMFDQQKDCMCPEGKVVSFQSWPNVSSSSDFVRCGFGSSEDRQAISACSQVRNPRSHVEMPPSAHVRIV
jgi:hypothetical protein